MKPRLVFVALLAGLLASQILSFVFKDIWPGYIEAQFMTPGINPNIAWMGYAAAAVLIFVSGYVSARLEWSHGWKDTLQTGASAGFLAGSLAYLFSSAPAASGLMGQKEILLSIPRTIANNDEGLKLLVQGIVNTIVWAQAVFWVFMLASMLLGSLGGLLSRFEGSGGWGKEPAPKALFLSQLTTYGIVFFALFNLLIIAATLGIMPNLVEKTMTELHGAVDGLLLPSWATFVFPLITGIAFPVVCLILIIQWALQSWQHPENRFRMKIWLVILALVILPIFAFIAYQLTLIFLGILLVIGLVLWLRQRLQPFAAEQEVREPQPYTVWDVLASALTQGIIVSSLGVGSLIAQALTLVLITVVNIVHLMNTGPLDSTAQEQITSLYTTSTVQNIAFFVVACIAGLIVAAVGIWIKGLRLPRQPQPQSVD